MARKERTFYGVITDRTAGVYDVVGPMTDDGPWYERIERARAETGHDIDLASFSDTEHSDEDLQSYERQFGLTRKRNFLSAPPDTSHFFQGALPDYAQTTDRGLLIKILCKGSCRSGHFAKLNKPYPGEEALKKANLGEYQATCLVCGHEASDNYNWYR